MGVKNLAELKQNFKALEMGPMNEEELNWMRQYRDLVYDKKSHIFEVPST